MRIYNVIKRTIRGLYYFHQKEILSLNYKVQCVMSGDNRVNENDKTLITYIKGFITFLYKKISYKQGNILRGYLNIHLC